MDQTKCSGALVGYSFDDLDFLWMPYVYSVSIIGVFNSQNANRFQDFENYFLYFF